MGFVLIKSECRLHHMWATSDVGLVFEWSKCPSLSSRCCLSNSPWCCCSTASISTSSSTTRQTGSRPSPCPAWPVTPCRPSGLWDTTGTSILPRRATPQSLWTTLRTDRWGVIWYHHFIVLNLCWKQFGFQWISTVSVHVCFGFTSAVFKCAS